MVTKSAKKAKKEWYPILADSMFNNVKIGESYVDEAAKLKGRNIMINLMTLTNDPKKQNFNILFKVNEVKDNSGLADAMGYYMVLTNVRRYSRKAVDKIEDSLIVASKDNVKYRIKPLFVTRFKTQAGILSKIRKTAGEMLIGMFKEIESKDVLMNVITNKIQMELRSQLKVIYPLSVSEIKVLEKV